MSTSTSPNINTQVSKNLSQDDISRLTLLSNLSIMKSTGITANVLMKQWWFLLIVFSLFAGFIVLFFLDIYLGFRDFIDWFDKANKSLNGGVPGSGFTLVMSFKHPILSGIWYSNKAFPAAVIYAYQFPSTNALLTNLPSGAQFLLQMWQYAAGLNLQPPNNQSVCQEPTQDLDVPGCIICAAFSQEEAGLCLETCPAANFSTMSMVGNVMGQTSMGIMTGAAIAGVSHSTTAAVAEAAGGPALGLIGAGIGGLLMLAFSLGTGLYERSQAIQQCESQRQQGLCNVQGAPPCS